MWSGLEGAAGTDELVAFAKKLGLKPEWIQRAGKPSEHFDLVASKRDKALRLGATVRRRNAKLTRKINDLVAKGMARGDDVAKIEAEMRATL